MTHKQIYDLLKTLNIEVAYEVEGAFKFFMEDLANLTFGDMYKSIFERKTAIEDLKRFVLDRPIGDFLFDLLSQVIFKEEQLRAVGIVGYGPLFATIEDRIIIPEFVEANLLALIIGEVVTILRM